MELYEIVMKLVGPVEPTGSHGIDMDRLENMKRMTELVDRLLFKIKAVSKNSDSQQLSIKELGSHARDFLLELQATDM